jgi:ATP-dependent DNA helicase RecG
MKRIFVSSVQKEFAEKLGEKLGERRRNILKVLKANSEATIAEIAEEIGVSETAIEKNLSWLKARGRIRRIGGARGGHWEVVCTESS